MFDNQSEKFPHYRSCYYIEHGVTFDPHHIEFCCDRKSPAYVKPEMTAAATVDRFLAVRDNVISANQRSNPLCERCSRFQEYEATNKMIEYINFATHSYCQFSCIY